MEREIKDEAPDSPIDLSQLSTRCRDLTSRSASESCLAPASSAAKKRRFKDPPPPPAPPSELRFRSMSNADLAACRGAWPEQVRARSQPANERVDAQSHLAAETLRQRCLSDSRLAAQGWPQPVAASHAPQPAVPMPSAPANVPPNVLPNVLRRSLVGSSTDILRAAADNTQQLEFLLRRTASESFLPSSRTGEPANSAAMEELVRRQHFLQQYQQLLVQHQQHESGAESSSSSASSPYVSPQWLFWYSQMLQQTFQAASHQPMTSIHDQVAGGQISAGPSSPGVPASSVSGSDGEGGEMEEDDDLTAFPAGKKRSPRALTGKHVRLGTGASPTTLHTLRLKIQERQRMKNSGGKKGLASNSSGSKLKSNKLKARAK